jgi:hypothetical protein
MFPEGSGFRVVVLILGTRNSLDKQLCGIGSVIFVPKDDFDVLIGLRELPDLHLNMSNTTSQKLNIGSNNE